METTAQYDHYIAVDWSITIMAIARMTRKSDRIAVVEVPASLAELKAYLKNLEGTKIMTIEETTPSHWLYVELKDFVDRLIICDPFRNRLLSEGAKSDKIDASKLVRLLKANLLKEVFHSDDQLLDLRHLVSAYEDLVKSGVRVKNQRYSLLRACGRSGEENIDHQLPKTSDQWILSSMERQIESYEKEKEAYERAFITLKKKHPEIRHQDSLPGIGPIGAVKIVSHVVTPERFPDAGHFLSYSGLIKLEKKSGLISYGRKNSRYCRPLKSVYKSAALATLRGDNEFNDYYESLIQKGYADYNARHKVARRLAVLSWGIFKSHKKYQRRHYVKGAQEV